MRRNRERDVRDQRRLADMGWHCITVWECQLARGCREQTLLSLEYTLNRIYLQDHETRYRLPEDDGVGMAAESDMGNEGDNALY